MDNHIRNAIEIRVKQEPFAKYMGMELIDLDDGFSKVKMTYDPKKMDNLFSRAHGGAIFALIDEAFETAGQTDGTVAVAMNVNVTYVTSPPAHSVLVAEARKVSQTKKTSMYDIRVTETGGALIACCHALAYRTGKPLPFFKK
jgi:acyl-CoA thioesterase